MVLYITSGFLLVCCVYLLWRSTKYVSIQQYQRVLDERQDIALDFVKEQERSRFLDADLQEVKLLLERERHAHMAVERTLESTNAYLQAQQEKFEEQKQEINDIRGQFNRDFRLMATQILEEKSQKFTQLNQQNLGLLLDPLKERIKLFEDKVDKSYAQEAAERNILKGVVEQLMQQSIQIKDEASNLTRALKGDSKKQGNWGEVILERVLERSGLTKGQEYRLQVSSVGEDNRRLQPDAIIELPDNKHLVVDAKISLKAYEQSVNAESDEERILLLKQHVQSVESHVRALSSKNYHSLYGINSPDFVLLFMPVESALSAAVLHKPELFSEAWDRQVVIVSPSTLLATLRTVAATWKQERQTRNVIEIAKEAGLLYDKFAGFLQDMKEIQVHLHRASSSHDQAMKKLTTGSGNVTRKIENLKALGAKASKQIGDDLLD